MASPSRKPPAEPPHPFKEEFAVILFIAALVILAIAAYFGINAIGAVLAVWFLLLALSTLVNVSTLIAYDIGYRGENSHWRALLGLVVLVFLGALAYLAYDAERVLNGLSMLWPR